MIVTHIIYYPCNYVDGSDNDADNDTDAVGDANAGAC